MENQPSKKKRKFVPGATKALLALTSVAGTVGLWNVISNQSLVEAQQASDTVETTLELPSLPTVAPLAQVNLDPTLEPGASPNPPLGSLRLVTPPAKATILANLPAKSTQSGNSAPSDSGSAPAPAANDPVVSTPAAADPVVTAAPATPVPSTPVPTTSTGSSK